MGEWTGILPANGWEPQKPLTFLGFAPGLATKKRAARRSRALKDCGDYFVAGTVAGSGAVGPANGWNIRLAGLPPDIR